MTIKDDLETSLKLNFGVYDQDSTEYRVAFYYSKWMAERCDQVFIEFAFKHGIQFGCDGSPIRSGARHRGNGSSDCPKELHHHHDDRCETPIQKILKELQ